LCGPVLFCIFSHAMAGCALIIHYLCISYCDFRDLLWVCG
jgi:hypothetical protein